MNDEPKREGAFGWGSEAEWEMEQRASLATTRDDVPKDVRELILILWQQYAIAAAPPSRAADAALAALTEERDDLSHLAGRLHADLETAKAALAKAKEHVFSLEATICSQRMRLAQLERRDRAAEAALAKADDHGRAVVRYLNRALAAEAEAAKAVEERDGAQEQAESFKAMYHQACDWRDAKIEALKAALAKACDMLASIGYPTTARDIRSSILATPETESHE